MEYTAQKKIKNPDILHLAILHSKPLLQGFSFTKIPREASFKSYFLFVCCSILLHFQKWHMFCKLFLTPMEKDLQCNLSSSVSENMFQSFKSGSFLSINQ